MKSGWPSHLWLGVFSLFLGVFLIRFGSQQQYLAGEYRWHAVAVISLIWLVVVLTMVLRRILRGNPP
jgi:uncharacterized membrane protein